MHSEFLELDKRCFIEHVQSWGPANKAQRRFWVPPRTRTQTGEVQSRPLKHALYSLYSLYHTFYVTLSDISRYISGLHGVVVTSEFYGSMQRLLGGIWRIWRDWEVAKSNDARMQDINSRGYKRLHQVARQCIMLLQVMNMMVFAKVCSKAAIVCGICIRFLPASWCAIDLLPDARSVPGLELYRLWPTKRNLTLLYVLINSALDSVHRKHTRFDNPVLNEFPARLFRLPHDLSYCHHQQRYGADGRYPRKRPAAYFSWSEI